MSEKVLNLLGLMRRANAIDIGETNSGAAVREGKAKLLLLASDASDNARYRAEGFITGRHTVLLPLPYTKEDISRSVGVSGCSMAAVTDIGFANALMKLLSEAEPDRYAAVAGEISERFSKAERRRQEAKTHERNKRNGKRRTNINEQV